MKNNRKIILYALTCLVIAFGGYKLTRLYLHMHQYETTDDAQVDGNIVPVLSRVGSYVQQVLVKENQVVNAGDLLIVLDSAELYSKAAQALASLESARAQSDVAEANLGIAIDAQQAARLSLEIPKTALWKARKDYNRYHELFELKVATPQQLDTYKANLETAQSQYDLAVQKTATANLQFQTASAQKKVAVANVMQKQKELDYARLQLSYTRITAPVAGAVSKSGLQPGQLIQPGQPLLSVVQDKEIWVTANFKETQLENIHKGNEVNISVDAFPDLKVSGTVESEGGATGSRFSLLPPDNASGNFVKVVQRVPVRIQIKQADETKRFLIPGLSVAVEVKK